MPPITTRLTITVQNVPFWILRIPWSVRAYFRWNFLLNIYSASFSLVIFHRTARL